MADAPPPSAQSRPPVSVVVPFIGDEDDANGLCSALTALSLSLGDEIILADNTPGGVMAKVAPDRMSVVPVRGERSSYHARNTGAGAAVNEWLLFLDSDTRPSPSLLSSYFSESIPEDVGALAGPMRPLSEGDGLVARYAAGRSRDKQARPLRHPYLPFGVTGNLLVRKRAFDEVGGFMEGIRSGGDADFCWRLQEAAGWRVGAGPGAEVGHLQREGLRAYLRVHARYGAGLRWLQRRWPRSGVTPGLARLPRAIAAIPWAFVRAQPGRAAFRALDAAVICAEAVGGLVGNQPRSTGEDVVASPEIAVMVDRFPEPSQTFVVNEARAIARAGRSVRIEARSRPRRPAFGAGWGLDVRWSEDSGPARRVADLLWLAARHPLRCCLDLVARRRWREQEEVTPLRMLAPVARRVAGDGVRHLHVHFARRSALDALRMRRLLGVPYSVTAHAYDIFQQPRNLDPKLGEAAFATSGCDYNVRRLRGLVSEPAARRIHRIVMGIDPEEFRRRAPYPPGGLVVGIGRLAEKKGFVHLVRAAAELRGDGLVDRVVIAGDGDQRASLAREIERLAVPGLIELPGPVSHEEVRELLEEAALLAMPCVVASDGDRDSMPVVVKEALAMGVPVVGTEEVGLPEVIRPEWGRLVPPGDHLALARAIRELLGMPVETRRAMGEAGRAYVAGELSVQAQTAALIELIESGPDGSP